MILRKWQENLNNLALRERILIAVLAISCVFALWDIAIEKPLQKKSKQLVNNLDVLKKRIANYDSQSGEFTHVTTDDSSYALQVKHHQYRRKLEKVNAQFDAWHYVMVSPKDMNQILRKLLEDNKGVGFRRMENRVLMQTGELRKGQKGEVPTRDHKPLYEHEIRINLQGNYFSILRYLQKVEKLPWRIYWDEFHYHVGKYPVAKVEIAFHTLNTHEGWVIV